MNFMDLFDKRLIIKQIPLFSALKPREINFILDRSEFVEYKKSEIIYKEGDPPDAFYCVVIGRVQLFTRDSLQGETILEYLHRGKYFGIISLLTDEPHSVTVRALNDTILLRIKKDDFDFILHNIPQLAIDLSRMLSRRLKRKDIHQKTIFESTIVSIFSSHGQAEKNAYSINLALSLKEQTHKSVIFLELCPQDKTHSCPAKFGACSGHKTLDISKLFTDLEKLKELILKNTLDVDLICLHYREDQPDNLKRLLDLLSLLVNDYHYIFLDLPTAMDEFILNILRQSDSVHILSGSDEIELKKTRSLVERLKTDFGMHMNNIKVIINEYKHSKLTHEEQLEILENNIFATLPKIEFESADDKLVLTNKESEYAKAVRRISRHEGDCLVGLALGVGVAYGFCHIGVLKVIEEENIPVDIISGSSVGALIAALWAVGKSSSEILKITEDFKEPKFFWRLLDWTVPLQGFIKGNKLYALLKKYLGNKTFQDVRIPLKIVASDVKMKEPIVFEKGSLIDAVMASCTMPGVFNPFKLREGILFDGGVINPLPTEPLINMGAKKIIAINVTPSREDIVRQYAKIKEGQKKVIAKHSIFNIKAFFKDLFRTNILDYIFSSIEILQSELAQKEAQFADIVLHPDTSGMYWLELGRAEEFAQRGEEEARRNLERIKQLLYE
ncbi:MAG: patatin-like phospholipase family protein [Candidatus Omnitrophota bacterium]